MPEGSGSLADVLERVLDKGVVIVGDIGVSVVDVELLTLRLRLFVASAQTAREMGLDWWSSDPFFTGRTTPEPIPQKPAEELENERLRARVAELETALGDTRAEEETTS